MIDFYGQNMNYVVRFIGVLLIASSSQLHAGLFLSQGEFDRSAAYGQASRFDSVGAIWDNTADGIYRFGGSAVLIAPQWVLASGHQVIRPGGPRGTTFDFRLGNDLSNMQSVHAISDVFVHPKWQGNDSQGSFTGQVDLALFKLASPVLTVTPAARNTIVEDSTFRGTQIFMAGFGQSGVKDNFVQPPDVKRGGTNLFNSLSSGWPYDDSEGLLNIVVRNIDNPNARDPNIDMEWVANPGDSGGGWFYERNGVLELAAITSGGGLPAISSNRSYAVRVSAYNDWIDSTITAVPEPSSLVFLGMAGSFILLRLRKNRIALCTRAVEMGRRSEDATPLLDQ